MKLADKKKSQMEGLTDGSVGKVLALQVLGHEFESPEHKARFGVMHLRRRQGMPQSLCAS